MRLLTREGYLTYLLGLVVRTVLRRQLTARKLLNLCVNLAFALLRLPHVTRLPSIIQVDINNICNLRCPACPTGTGAHPKPKGQMAFDAFQRLIDEVRDHVFLVILFNSGEPFMNKDVYRMVEYAAASGMAVVTSSNGNFFEKQESAEALVRSGIDTVIVSISGITQETYGRYHINGDCRRVLTGIRNITVKKKLLRSRTPILVMRYLAFDYNACELEDATGVARELGIDYCEIRPSMTPEEFREVRFARSFERECGEAPGMTSHCYWLWSVPVVQWDGSLAPCCFINLAPPEQGNVFREGGLAAVWSGERFRDFRRRMLTDKSQIPSCATCQSFPGIQEYFNNKRKKKMLETPVKGR